MKKAKATNVFNKGMIMDLNPIVTPNNVLTNCLNGTIITFNGNENALQNDMGNGRVETAYLPEGYIPLGTTSFGGIVYIVSYNPNTDKCLIGSFPSPERNITSDEVGYEGDNKISFSDNDFIGNVSNHSDLFKGYKEVIAFISKKKLSDVVLHSGDKFLVCADNLKNVTNYTLDGTIKNNGNISLKLATIDTYGSIIYLDKVSLKLIEEDKYHPIKVGKIESTSGTDVSDYRKVIGLDYDIYTSKIAGNLYIVGQLEMFDNFEVAYNVIDIKVNEDDTKDITLEFEFTCESDNGKTFKTVEIIPTFSKCKLQDGTKPLKLSVSNDSSLKQLTAQYTFKCEQEAILNLEVIPTFDDKILIPQYTQTLDIPFDKFGDNSIESTIWKYYNEDSLVIMQFNLAYYLTKGKSVNGINIYAVGFATNTLDSLSNISSLLLDILTNISGINLETFDFNSIYNKLTDVNTNLSGIDINATSATADIALANTKLRAAATSLKNIITPLLNYSSSLETIQETLSSCYTTLQTIYNSLKSVKEETKENEINFISTTLDNINTTLSTIKESINTIYTKIDTILDTTLKACIMRKGSIEATANKIKKNMSAVLPATEALTDSETTITPGEIDRDTTLQLTSDSLNNILKNVSTVGNLLNTSNELFTSSTDIKEQLTNCIGNNQTVVDKIFSIIDKYSIDKLNIISIELDGILTSVTEIKTNLLNNTLSLSDSSKLIIENTLKVLQTFNQNIELSDIVKLAYFNDKINDITTNISNISEILTDIKGLSGTQTEQFNDDFTNTLEILSNILSDFLIVDDDIKLDNVKSKISDDTLILSIADRKSYIGNYNILYEYDDKLSKDNIYLIVIDVCINNDEHRYVYHCLQTNTIFNDTYINNSSVNFDEVTCNLQLDSKLVLNSKKVTIKSPTKGDDYNSLYSETNYLHGIKRTIINELIYLGNLQVDITTPYSNFTVSNILSEYSNGKTATIERDGSINMPETDPSDGYIDLKKTVSVTIGATSSDPSVRISKASNTLKITLHMSTKVWADTQQADIIFSGYFKPLLLEYADLVKYGLTLDGNTLKFQLNIIGLGQSLGGRDNNGGGGSNFVLGTVQMDSVKADSTVQIRSTNTPTEYGSGIYNFPNNSLSLYIINNSNLPILPVFLVNVGGGIMDWKYKTSIGTYRNTPYKFEYTGYEAASSNRIAAFLNNSATSAKTLLLFIKKDDNYYPLNTFIPVFYEYRVGKEITEGNILESFVTSPTYADFDCTLPMLLGNLLRLLYKKVEEPYSKKLWTKGDNVIYWNSTKVTIKIPFNCTLTDIVIKYKGLDVSLLQSYFTNFISNFKCFDIDTNALTSLNKELSLETNLSLDTELINFDYSSNNYLYYPLDSTSVLILYSQTSFSKSGLYYIKSGSGIPQIDSIIPLDENFAVKLFKNFAFYNNNLRSENITENTLVKASNLCNILTYDKYTESVSINTAYYNSQPLCLFRMRPYEKYGNVGGDDDWSYISNCVLFDDLFHLNPKIQTDD